MELRLLEDGLLIGAYLNGSDKNIIWCPGLPQYPTNYHGFIQDLAKLGYNIFVPRYAGTWESDGEFSPLTSAASIEKTIEVVKRGSALDAYGQNDVSWQTNDATLTIIGFSYGALPALVNNNRVARTLLLMPFVTVIDGDSSADDIKGTLEFVQRGYKNVYRTNLTPDDFLGQYQNIYGLTQPSSKNITVVRGALDKSISNMQFDWLKQNYAADVQELPVKHTPNLGYETYERLLTA